MNELRHIRVNESRPTLEWMMPHAWMSCVIHMNESCPTYMSRHTHARVTSTNKPCPKYECVMSHMCISRVIRTYKWVLSQKCAKLSSCFTILVMSHRLSHTHGWVDSWIKSHIWMSHITHMSESVHTYERVSESVIHMRHIWASQRVIYTYETHTSESASLSDKSHMIWLICASHIAHMSESASQFYVYNSVLLLLGTKSHVTHLNEPDHTDSCHTHKRVICLVAYRVFWHLPLKMLHLQHPPNRETQISRYLAVKIQFQIWVWFEFVQRNSGLSIWKGFVCGV